MKRKRRSLADMMYAAHDRALVLRGYERRRRDAKDIASAEDAANEAECFEDLADLVGTIIPVTRDVGRIISTVTIPVRPAGGSDPPPGDPVDDEEAGDQSKEE